MAARLCTSLIELASDGQRGTDGMKVILYLAGVLVETSLVFARPDLSLQASYQKLSTLMRCRPEYGVVLRGSLPPAHIIDFETEKGRQAAREYFIDCLDCAFEFHDLLLNIMQSIFMAWEIDGIKREESLRLLMECANRCMAFEIAAQELCDIVIDKKVTAEGWSLADCIASLSAVAGRRLALSMSMESCAIFRGADLPESLDRVVYVMTQEAVRLGVPAGSDWRFGLAANDMPVNAPHDLVFGIEPYCQSFFRAILMRDQYEQAVSCAKAAGRMLAVAAGGDVPEMEPAIAKPLAMAAITETYKSVCMEYRVVSY